MLEMDGTSGEYETMLRLELVRLHGNWRYRTDARLLKTCSCMDVLKERHPQRPVVCFDEASKQLVEEVREPIRARPGRLARRDGEYGAAARGACS